MKYFSKNEMKCKCCEQLPDEALQNGEALVDNVLDPVREKFGKAIKTNSFYRCSKTTHVVVGHKPHNTYVLAIMLQRMSAAV